MPSRSTHLQHRHEMTDMRAAYSHPPPDTRYPTSRPATGYSYRTSPDSSNERPLTSPPSYHSTESSHRRPVVVNHVPHDNDRERYFDDRRYEDSPRSSEESIASTVQSEEDLQEDVPEYDVPELTVRPCNDGSNILNSTPRDFSYLFPSKRHLMIRHDDTTIDGNMNLRVDTEVVMRDRKYDMTLFHLRMHDLKNREFSLRRHCRNSGREVCHSSRKSGTPKRPGFPRSLSNALQSIRPKSEHRNSVASSLTRHDSGYGSLHSMDKDDAGRPGSAGRGASEPEQAPTNSIKLEFSNYAQAEVRRAGKSSTRYEFEYWGVQYFWKRIALRTAHGTTKEISFQLRKVGSDTVFARIDPIPLTPRQAHEERSKGGWITPSDLQITDDSILHCQKDVCDVIVAAGLMALVDDSIRTRFLSKRETSLLIPVPKVSLEVQHLAPKQLINEMFNRKGDDRVTSATTSARASR